MAARIYWEEVLPEGGAFDPANRLIFATGPCAGFYGLSGARWVVCGKSPATDPQLFTHANLGGSWGTELKFAGFDALIVQGKAEKPVYLLIDDGKIKIEDASSLWGKGAAQTRQIIKGKHGDYFRVVAAGPGGDNMTAMALLLADNDSSGSGGLGGVMGSKNLKSIAVRGSGVMRAARPGRLQELLEYVAKLRKDAPQSDSGVGGGDRTDHCSDCTDECNRGLYEAADGSKGKFMCSSSSFYKELAFRYYGELNDVPFYANRLCDDYGLNTKSVAPIIAWLERCYEAGLLTEKETGLPLTKIGSLEFIQALLETIAYRRGFGEILGNGIHKAALEVGGGAEELVYDDVTKAGERMTYAPKAYITTGLLYAVDSRQPIQQLHEVIRLGILWVRWAKGSPNANLSSSVFRNIARKFWGSELAADFSTYDGKALAAKMIQDRQLAKECLILCDNVWPIAYVEHSDDHVGDPTLESKVFSAITGRDLSEDEFYRVGEKVLNLQRATMIREGLRGRDGDILSEASFTVPLKSERLNPDCLFPGQNGEIISRKGAVFERDKFLSMLSEFYELRGWNRENGLQTKVKLEDLDLSDVARDLEKRGLLS
jgi:aldehyde:ferredoxin oxidoreductase